MQNGFQKILVPVYSSFHWQPSMIRAVEWADKSSNEITVVNIVHPFSKFKAKLFNRAAGNMQVSVNWEERFKQIGVNISDYPVHFSSVVDAVNACLLQVKYDLVILPVKKKWNLGNDLFSAKLATSAGVPVLRVGKDSGSTVSIVVPVQQDVAGNTLEKISEISRKSQVNVHLVAYRQKINQPKEDVISIAVLQAYQWLKSYVKCPVEFSIITGVNPSAAVDNYLHRLDNDVLLLQ